MSNDNNEQELGRDTLLITRKRLGELVTKENKLEALMEAGVEDWIEYEFAMEIFDQIENGPKD